MAQPARGEIWLADLNPTKGHKQSGLRPVLVISVDSFNSSAADLIVILPISKAFRGIPLHIEIKPQEGGLDRISYIMCDQIRTISKDRLDQKLGRVNPNTLRTVEDRLKILLKL